MDAAHHLLRLFLLALAQDHITGVKIVHQQPVTAGRYRASFKQRPPYCKQGGPQPGAIKQLIRTFLFYSKRTLTVVVHVQGLWLIPFLL